MGEQGYDLHVITVYLETPNAESYHCVLGGQTLDLVVILIPEDYI